MPPPGGYYEQPADTSRFDNGEPSGILRVADAPVSTFSADVDTASYSIVRRFLNQQALPPSEAVRIEEMINAFDYDYSAPKSADEPFAADVSVFGTPWNEKTELIRIGVRGYDLEPEEVPDSNVVLLLDVSGSMNAPDKLPLLKESMKLLAGELGEDDTLAVVVYAGAAGVVLEPTGGNEKLAIREALDRLSAGGSTAGGEGIELAYDLAEQNLRKDAVNRVILATDGDFNVGVTSDERLEDLVARKRETGIYLSVLGFGAGNLNDTMMQRIAQNGNGVAAYIDDLAEARRVLVREFTSSMFPIAEDLKFQVEFNPSAVSEYRLIGYETRALREEDFDNDRIDAGDIGSGHTVTALYEVTRAGEAGSLPDRRYDEKDAAPYDPDAELAFLKIRYKRPGEDDSRLITRPITPADRTDAPSEDARFAAAVAALGEKLGRSGRADGLSYDALIEMANGAKGRDEYGDRAGFVQLVRIAESLDRPGEGD
ncbi:vWA domain-containing protein [Parvularcula dongshanensis]|nr:VWA domain-containing protein [Parvularcula dongshanensis]